MGANLSGGRAGRLCRRTARPRQHRSAKETAKGCRRRSAGRSAATARGERLPKKLASLGFGRRATPAQKTLVVQKLRQKHALKPQNQGKAKGLAAYNSQTASPFGCLNNFYFKILSNFWESLQILRGLSFYLEKSRRVRAAAAAQKTPCAGLGPKEPVSAGPTVDVGPECVLSAVSGQNTRFGAKSPWQKKAMPFSVSPPRTPTGR